jgi:DNA-binding transcriptional LysR family regulator
LPLDWNDLRFFMAVARAGTLARAAAELDVDQTTVGRRVASLEGKLRIALYDRTSTKLTLTAAGDRVLLAAEQMAEAAQRVTIEASESDATASGTVRVATSDSLAEAFVVPAAREIRQRHPNVSVVIATGWAAVDLRKGEADLAVRLVKPTDPRLATRKLATFALRLYASREYVERRGMPTSLAGHELIAYELAVRTRKRAPFANQPMSEGALALLSNSHGVLLAAGRAGVGIVELPSFVGDATPDLVRVLPKVEAPYAVWHVVPLANRRVHAVRVVSEAIADAFKRHPAS